MAIRSTGTVSTDRPERYGKQLTNHMSRRHGGEWFAETSTGWIDLSSGRVEVSCPGGTLTLVLDSPDEETSAQLEHVIDIHLVRFAGENEISTAWVREQRTGTPEA